MSFLYETIYEDFIATVKAPFITYQSELGIKIITDKINMVSSFPALLFSMGDCIEEWIGANSVKMKTLRCFITYFHADINQNINIENVRLMTGKLEAILRLDETFDGFFDHQNIENIASAITNTYFSEDIRKEIGMDSVISFEGYKRLKF